MRVMYQRPRLMVLLTSARVEGTHQILLSFVKREVRGCIGFVLGHFLILQLQC